MADSGVKTVVAISQTAWLAVLILSLIPFFSQSSFLLPSGVMMLISIGFVCRIKLPPNREKHEQHEQNEEHEQNEHKDGEMSEPDETENNKQTNSSKKRRKTKQEISKAETSKAAISKTEASSSKPSKVFRRGLLYYTCCVFAWSCIIDLILYLEVMGTINGYMAFYLESGEPYFDTSFGALSLFWDFAVHYPLYLYIIHCIDTEVRYRHVLLFWCGSMITSLFCLLTGALSGTFGANIYPAIWLNVPYIILPVYFLFETLRQPRHLPKAATVQNHLKNTSTRRMLLFGSIMVLIFSVIRGLAALQSPLPLVQLYAVSIEPYVTDPSMFGSAWVLLFMCFGCFLQMMLIQGLYQRRAEWVMDWSIIYCAITIHGSYLQLAQFCPGVGFWSKPPLGFLSLFVNLLIPTVALGIAWLCRAEPDFFRNSSDT